MTFEEYKAKYEKVPVVEVPSEVREDPLVSVKVLAYNHAPFIRRCLEGILAQKTEFSYEIVIGEDESTDGTREICMEYAKRFPKKIRLFLGHRENNIKFYGRATGMFNSYYINFSTHGKYIAACEGDDEWTDPLKLQKQISFLEEHPKCSVICGGYTIRKNGEDKVNVKQAQPSQKKTDQGFWFNIEENWTYWYTQALTVSYRNDREMHEFIANYSYSVDIHRFYHLLKKGDGFYWQENLGVYNRHPGGMYSGASKQEILLAQYATFKELHEVNQDEFTRKGLFFLNQRIYLLKKTGEFRADRLPYPPHIFKEAFSLASKPIEYLYLLKNSIPIALKRPFSKLIGK